MKLEKLCSLKKLSLVGCRGERAGLSINTPLGYMVGQALVREWRVVGSFFVVEAGEGRAESKLFVRRAQSAGALHDKADGPRSKQYLAQVRSTVRPCSMSKCAVRCGVMQRWCSRAN
jgi:hypothetical protein